MYEQWISKEPYGSVINVSALLIVKFRLKIIDQRRQAIGSCDRRSSQRFVMPQRTPNLKDNPKITILTLIQPGEVKVDFVNFDVKFRTKFLYVGFF
jgi:hypothetical protein